MSDNPIRKNEKILCKAIWDTVHKWLDNQPEGADLWPLWDLKHELEEVLPYGPEEVKDG